MNIRRLGWAGLELTSDDTTIVIDFVRSFGFIDALLVAEPREPFPEPERSPSLALVTHLHADHCDPKALASLPDGAEVLRPSPGAGTGEEAAATDPAEQGLEHHGVDWRAVEPWDTTTHGPFTITALPAVDGFGDPQVSWLVEADGTRLVHAGDTMFHGFWWSVVARHGPVDVAALPINGPVCDFPNTQPPSPFPAAMTAHEAAVAASMLQAARALPIHYGNVMRPGVYDPANNPLEKFALECEGRGVELAPLGPGEALSPASAT